MVSPGAYIGAWRLERRLGTGSMGTVWRAHDAGGRVAAVKITADTALADLEALAQVCHPAIPAVLDAGTMPSPYVAMELARGRALDALLADQGALELPDALWVCAVLADALAALHATGTSHNDLKPANIVVSSESRRSVTLVDLGMAAQRGGTLAYAAPERTSGAPGSAAADVYGLGLVLWEMLHGQLPWPELPEAEAVVRRRRGVPEMEGGPRWLQRLLAEMLAVRAAERPPARRVVDTLAAHGIDVPVPDAALLDRRARAVHIARPEAEAALADLQEHPGAVSVVGRSGAGCSHLLLRQWRQLVARGERVVMLMLDGNPWGAITAALSDPQLDGEPASLPRESSAEARAAMAAELLRSRVDGPMWVLLDDWHLACAGTQLTLERLAAMSDVRVLVGGHDGPDWAERVELQPLDRAGTQAIVAGILGQQIGLDPLVEAIVGMGSVWPGAVRAVVTTAAQTGALVSRGRRWIVVEDALNGLVDEVVVSPLAIDGLDADVRCVAEFLGAARGPLCRTLLHELVELDDAALDGALDTLTSAELVLVEGEVARPVSTAAAAALSPDSDRAPSIHARLARVFAAHDCVPLQRLGRHVVAAQDPSLAARWGVSVVRALDAADPQAAASVGRALLELAPTTALAVAVVGSMTAAGQVDEARRVAAEVLASEPAGPELVPVHIALARLLSGHDQRHDEALAHLDRALAVVDAEAPMALREVQAQVLFRAGRHGDAIAVASAARRPPADAARDVDAWIGVRIAQAQALEASGDLEAAVALLEGVPAELGRGRARRALADAALG